MPTFFDSAADAAEASEPLRGLAHASRSFDQPAQMYGVIGDLSSRMRSLHQVLEQLADVHERKAAHAFHDDGDHAAGVRDALATAEELRQSARLVDQAYDRLAEGFVAAGRIAWHPEPAVEEAVPSRWINVVFLQGDEADRQLRILGELGHVDAVDYLAQWDYGEATTQAALENGYDYDEPGEGTNDRVMMSEGAAELADLTSHRPQLEDEQEKLLRAHYAGAVSVELLEREQDRITASLETIQNRIDAHHGEYAFARANLDDSLTMLSNAADIYKTADDANRRLCNQALFRAIYIDEDNDVRVGYKTPYDGLSVEGLQADALTWAAEAKKLGQARTPTKG